MTLESKNGIITFYSKTGEILGTFPLKSGTYHSDRCQVAKEGKIKEWSHYTMHGKPHGMTKDGDYWIDINPDTGLIAEITSIMPKQARIINEFKKEIQEVLSKYQFQKKVLDNYNGADEHIGENVYFVIDNEPYYGQTVAEILKETFGYYGND
jgi:hypothetical protein